MPFPRLAVLVINYRTPQLTLQCLESLAPELQDEPRAQVLLLDSGSNDGSADVLEEQVVLRRWEGWVQFFRLETNRGFSAANNAGFARAQLDRFDAFLLLNNDTVVLPGAIRRLTDALQEDRSLGIVGPRLQWPDGEIQVSCFRNIRPVSELLAAAKTGPISRVFSHAQVALFQEAFDGPLEWISFACVLIRREVIESVGPMDEAFFMYFEDVDYCRRVREAGWKIGYVSEARIVHLRGGRAAEEFVAEERKRRPAYYYKSRARYLAKYYGPTGPLQANVCWLVGRAVSLAREILGNKPPHTAAREATDIWKGSLCGFTMSQGAQNGQNLLCSLGR